MLFRTLLHVLFLSRRKPDLGHWDVAKTRFITLPTDLDINRHMNNGVYLSIMDVARFDMLVRNGIWALMREKGWYPVVASETITFRKSLNLWDRFTIETRLIGFDDKAVYVEQRFVRPSTGSGSKEPEVYATGFIRGRFLRKTGGTVPVSELIDAFGTDVSGRGLPEWIERWGATSHSRRPARRRRRSGADPRHGGRVGSAATVSRPPLARWSSRERSDCIETDRRVSIRSCVGRGARYSAPVGRVATKERIETSRGSRYASLLRTRWSSSDEGAYRDSRGSRYASLLTTGGEGGSRDASLLDRRGGKGPRPAGAPTPSPAAEPRPRG